MCEGPGIVGAVESGPDFTTFGPILKVKRSGGQILIDWGWQGYSKFLAIWKYKAIYRVDDERVGQAARRFLWLSAANFRRYVNRPARLLPGGPARVISLAKYHAPAAQFLHFCRL